MSEKHKISRDMKIVKYSGGWEIISGAAKADGVCGEIWLLLSEIDAIHAYVHKDDAPDPDDVKVADDEPKSDCRKCIYRRICKIVYQSANVCINYTLPEEWEEGEPEEVEKATCRNCRYWGGGDCMTGYCCRYPEMLVKDYIYTCGEHRLRE